MYPYTIITRGVGKSYIIFEYYCFVELLNNTKISDFIEKNCYKSKIYYAQNYLRDIPYDENEYNNLYKLETEVWISITFDKTLLDEFENLL